MRPYFAFLLIAAFWSNGSVGWAQKAPSLDTLENLKAKALANNADLPVAEAKVNIAQAHLQVAKAELIQTRHRIGEKVKTHPDLGVAEAKLLVAEAKLQLAIAERARTRQQLLAQVAVAYAEAEATLHAETEAQERYTVALELSKRRSIGQEEFSVAKVTYLTLKANRIGAEARLQALVGATIVQQAPAKKEPGRIN
jgi:hypothetical protein